MGWIQEFADLFGKLAFYKIVHEYEQGLYFRAGRVRERRLPNRSIKPKDLEIPWKIKNKEYQRYYHLFDYFELKKLIDKTNFQIIESNILGKNLVFVLKK